MIDPANENGHDGNRVTWRLKLSEDEIVLGLGGPIVLELADANGSALATVSIPSETIEVLLRPHLSIFAELQLEGSVFLDTEFFALLPTPKTTDICELVRQGIAPEMLQDEPRAKEQLQVLRQRLTDALALVDQTLSDLDKQEP